MEKDLLVGKQQVDLLEGEILRFRVEQVDEWEEAKVEDYILN